MPPAGTVRLVPISLTFAELMTSPVFSARLVARWLLVLVLVAGAYFFSGFLVPGLAALIIGFASWPIFQRWVRICGGRTTLAASGALVLILVGLVVPLSLAVSYGIHEASNFVGWLLAGNRYGLPVPHWLVGLPLVGERFAGYWQEHLGQPQALGSWVQLISGEHLGNIYRLVLSATGNAFHLALTVIFMLIILFFVYKDGDRIVAQLDILGERILPARWMQFSRVVPATVSATVTGMGLIAIGEALSLGVAYWIAGVPSPVLLGLVTGFMALIPGGAPVAFSMVSLYLVGSGNVVAGIGLFIWGTIELFVVDKTLRPRLVGGPVKLPFLPTFLGLVGGVQTMGLVGLFVGPVLMALLVAVWREWLRAVVEERQCKLVVPVKRLPEDL